MEGKGFDILLVNGYVQRKVNLKFLNLIWEFCHDNPKTDGLSKFLQDFSLYHYLIVKFKISAKHWKPYLLTEFGLRKGSLSHYHGIWLSQITKVRNFSKFSSFGDLLWGISGEFFDNKFLWRIPRKFLRNSPELVPNLRDFEGFRVLRISFEKFLRFSPKFFPRNSWQIFWNISLERTCQIIRWDV